MKRCINCKHYRVADICSFCAANGDLVKIKFPHFMGGPKKCSYYEQNDKYNKKFTYPTKNREEK